MLMTMMVMTISAATPVAFDSMTPEQLTAEYHRLERERADVPSPRGPAVAGTALFGAAGLDFLTLMLFSNGGASALIDVGVLAILGAVGMVVFVAAVLCELAALARTTWEASEHKRIDARLGEVRKRLASAGAAEAPGLVPVLSF